MTHLPQLSVSIFLTNESDELDLTDTPRVNFYKNSRLTRDRFNPFDRDDTVAYLCGPPAMSDEINSWLDRATVKYEKWW